MSNILRFIKQNFLSKKFITFGIIGLVNTFIHMLVYGIFYQDFQAGAFLSNVIAFVSASVFSYLANAYFTFKPTHKSSMQFGVVMLVFLMRLVVSSFLTSVFDYIVIEWIQIDYAVYPIATYIAPFFASALLIPVAYFILDIVFKKTSDYKNKKNEQS